MLALGILQTRSLLVSQVVTVVTVFGIEHGQRSIWVLVGHGH